MSAPGELVVSLTKSQRKNRNRKRRQIELATAFEGIPPLSSHQQQRPILYANEIQQVKCLGLKCSSSSAVTKVPCVNCGWYTYCSHECQQSSVEHKSLFGQFACNDMVNMNSMTWKHLSDAKASSLNDGPGNNSSLTTISNAIPEIQQHIFILEIIHLTQEHVKLVMSDDNDATKFMNQLGSNHERDYMMELLQLIQIIDDLKMNASPSSLFLFKRGSYSNILEMPAQFKLCSECNRQEPLVTCRVCGSTDRCSACPHEIQMCLLIKTNVQAMRRRLYYINRDADIMRKSIQLQNSLHKLVADYDNKSKDSMEHRYDAIQNLMTIFKQGDNSTLEVIQQVKQIEDRVKNMHEMVKYIKTLEREEAKAPQPGEEQLEGR